MLNLNKLQEEYANYQQKINYINNLENIVAYIIIASDAMVEQRVDIIREMKQNSKDQLIASLKSILLIGLNQDEVKYYQKDSEVLDEAFTFITKFIEYYTKIKSVVDEDNFQETTKFIDFLEEIYNQQIEHFDSKRAVLELTLSGYECCTTSNEEDYKEIDSFINEKIEEISKEKSKEKVKKLI